jgi:hypothetical protein
VVWWESRRDGAPDLGGFCEVDSAGRIDVTVVWGELVSVARTVPLLFSLLFYVPGPDFECGEYQSWSVLMGGPGLSRWYRR